MATSSSDSDSDTEETKRLREAAVEISVSSATPGVPNRKKCKNTLTEKRLAPGKPSLRITHNSQDEDKELQTTPEFRTHIAKKLTSYLDKSVKVFECSSQGNDPPSQDIDLESEFKLFTTSIPGHENLPKPKKKRPPSSSSDSSEDERCRSIAVSGDYILSNSKLRIGSCSDESDSKDDVKPSASVNEITLENKERKIGLEESSLKLGNGNLKKHKKKKKKAEIKV